MVFELETVFKLIQTHPLTSITVRLFGQGEKNFRKNIAVVEYFNSIPKIILFAMQNYICLAIFYGK